MRKNFGKIQVGDVVVNGGTQKLTVGRKHTGNNRKPYIGRSTIRIVRKSQNKKEEGKDAPTISFVGEMVVTSKRNLEGEEVSKKKKATKDTSVTSTIYRGNIEPINSINIAPKRARKRGDKMESYNRKRDGP